MVHLKRDSQALVDWGGAARPGGLAGLGLVERLVDAWHAARDAPAGRAQVGASLAPLQAAVRRLLAAGRRNARPKAAGLWRALRTVWPARWTFVTGAGVEPTTPAAERAIRPAVRWRRGRCGRQHEAGAAFVSRLLAVAATCRQQERSLRDYLTPVWTAAQPGHPMPSFLPKPTLAQAA